MGLFNKKTKKKSVKEPEKPNISKEIYSRSIFLYYLFFGLSLIIIYSIISIQYGSDGDKLREEARNDQKFMLRTSYAKRGDVLDYKDRLLSTSIPNYHIYMDFKAEGLIDSIFHKEVKPLSVSLNNFFKDRDAQVYEDSLRAWYKGGFRYKRVSPRRINYLELKEVLKFPLYNRGRNRGGFMLDTLNKRFFPHGNLARRTIGRKNETGSNYGIEGFFNEDLSGINGLTAMQKISGNFWMPVRDERNVAPIDGYDVVSTLDIEVQRVAEDALRKQLTDNDALWGTAILMEVETGEIRAIANLSQNKENKTEYYEDYNHAIGQNMEPGSTFKLISLMALLDDAKSTINTPFNTEGGQVNVSGAIVRDTRKGGYGTIPLRKCFEVSSNICFAKAINRYYGARPNKFIDYLEKLKFTDSFNLQIAGERMPLIRRPSDKFWDGTTLTMMAYGYALMMTPLKTLTYYNAIANNGEMVRPRLVTEVRNKGVAVKTFPKDVMVDKICSDNTLSEIKSSLEGVVNDGTARLILLNNNYKVAGKTGTAQVAKGKLGYTINGGRYYLATVVGYFPADKPKYSCVVAIETFYPFGSGKKYYGGALSGPVFRAIADKVYSLTPEWVGVIDKPEKAKQSKQPVIERVMSAPEVKRGLSSHTKVINEKFKITKIDTISTIFSGMPNVLGMPLRDAIYILESQKLTVRFKGNGVVKEQSVVPGVVYNIGDTINLVLE